ncbi:amidohydrolase family protein [Jiella mangrovi]|uniref:Amidohydrolase family protein n=1 Tax=Jiella mangrovi TaxID=2821407 RepID=A0ABS4BMW1_9HYPH|nr:amidohydrolase family protein [Jiella mangrovi]MBP0618058.1 amidohydrolase family protein [Jiella mangrovi]
MRLETAGRVASTRLRRHKGRTSRTLENEAAALEYGVARNEKCGPTNGRHCSQQRGRNLETIDAHHHFWNPARGDYGWMPPDDPVLARPYLPVDLAPALQAAGVGRSILVQAAPTTAETEYLLGLADASDHVAGVVGWIDFERPEEIDTLRRLSAHPKFLGVRPMIQDIADEGWMLRDDLDWAFRAICDLDLTFDALGFPRHIEPFLALFDRYPAMRVVLDHCLKPTITDESPESFDEWARGIARIANGTTAFCKLSGLVTEAKDDWRREDLAYYSSHVLEVFGPERVMWGSDWPVCRLRCEYEEWHKTAVELVSHLSDAARARVFSGSAKAFYRLT